MKVFLTIFALSLFSTTSASNGDRSGAYQNCLKPCVNNNCSGVEYPVDHPLYLKAMGWDCKEECKYSCMWVAVDIYADHGVACPQFHGKWPFIRILGMQEPASVLFSVLNGVATIIGFRRYLREVPTTTPMFNVAVLQAVVGVNAWIWSAVYHSRDFVWTETLDYFCATSLVMFSFYVAIHRWSYEARIESRARIRWIAGHVLAGLYVTHICYLSFDKFDYGYNMKANVAIALSNSVAWLWLWKQKKISFPYFWKIFFIIVATQIFLLFELFDFPPLLWILDAHSIWHLLTIPMPVLMFSFFKDDHLNLESTSSKDKVP
uniref:Post-GPI attachment to proteins factor 3 n=1 Tax=Phallusia mammillata TaxID=59560 RepID=A0A6F9DP89_9ASCI|nr:post-GPI attachment to proteins factor 3 [Phallusia mammillata]